MKTAKMNPIRRIIIILALVAGFTGTAGTTRPTTPNLYAYLTQLGPVGFGASGSAYLPQTVLQGMKGGQVSPIMQFVLMNHLMNEAVKDVVKRYPARRDSYLVATGKFTDGLCRIQKAFQQGMLMMFLPQLSNKDSYGGSSDASTRQGNQQMAMMMAQAFQKSKGCGTGGDQGGIDPMMIALLSQ